VSAPPPRAEKILGDDVVTQFIDFERPSCCSCGVSPALRRRGAHPAIMNRFREAMGTRSYLAASVAHQ
jgi:hypothetical protein